MHLPIHRQSVERAQECVNFRGTVHRILAFFAPVAIALLLIAQGKVLPSNGLMRHLQSWQVQFDYRTRHPLSDLPKFNPWVDFDAVLWHMQNGAGLSPHALAPWVQAVCVLLLSLVLFDILECVLSRHRHAATLFLLSSTVALLALMQSTLLGRPEMFLLIFAASAWLCPTLGLAALWGLYFFLLLRWWWFGWVFAPFALLLAPRRLSLGCRTLIALCLTALHWFSWKIKSGSHLTLLHQQLGSAGLSMFGDEVRLPGLSLWHFWFCSAALTLVMAVRSRQRWSLALTRALALALTVAGALLAVQTPTEDPPRFSLDSYARVYSEAPDATVFYSAPGIAVEPSFAPGATRAPWRALHSDLAGRCDLLLSGGFTHVVEKSLAQPIPCAHVQQVQGPWRLWRIERPGVGPLAPEPVSRSMDLFL